MADTNIVWLQRYLSFKSPTVYERIERELIYDNGRILPAVGDLPFGATDILTELVEQRGEAKIVAAGDNDIPMVDVQITEDKWPVVRLAACFRYSDEELEAAEFAEQNGQITTNLKDRRMFACKRAVDEKSNLLGAYGDSKKGISGLLNNPSVPVANLSVGPHDPGATPDDMIQFAVSSWDIVMQNTYLMTRPDKILLPYKTYSLFNSTFRASSSDSTVLDQIKLRLQPLGLTSIEPINETKSSELVKYGAQASGVNKDRMVIYKLDPMDGFKRHFTPYKQSQPEYRNMGYNVYMVKKVSAVYTEYPNNAIYVDYPKAA